MLGGMDTKQTSEQIQQAGLNDWQPVEDALRTTWLTKDFVTGLALVNKIGAAAEAMQHHPDIDLRYGSVGVRLTSHDVGGVTERDLTLARQISDLAAEADVEAGPGESPVNPA